METTVLRAAAALETLGPAVHTVGVGQEGDIHAPLLRAIASEPGNYHYAPDAEELGSIYEAIASRIRCPPEVPRWP